MAQYDLTDIVGPASRSIPRTPLHVHSHPRSYAFQKGQGPSSEPQIGQRE